MDHHCQRTTIHRAVLLCLYHYLSSKAFGPLPHFPAFSPHPSTTPQTCFSPITGALPLGPTDRALAVSLCPSTLAEGSAAGRCNSPGREYAASVAKSPSPACAASCSDTARPRVRGVAGVAVCIAALTTDSHILPSGLTGIQSSLAYDGEVVISRMRDTARFCLQPLRLHYGTQPALTGSDFDSHMQSARPRPSRCPARQMPRRLCLPARPASPVPLALQGCTG